MAILEISDELFNELSKALNKDSTFLDDYTFNYFDIYDFNSRIGKNKDLANLAISLDQHFEKRVIEPYNLTDRQIKSLVRRITFKLNRLDPMRITARINYPIPKECLILNNTPNAQFFIKTGIITTFSRFIFSVVHGNIKITGKEISHDCGHFGCCNPSHLIPMARTERLGRKIIPMCDYTHSKRVHFG